MHTFMEKIRNANTKEELKAIMCEVFTMHAAKSMSDEAFSKIYDVFEIKRDEIKNNK